MNPNLLYPMASLVGFTLLFSCYMLFCRVTAVRSGKLKFSYFKIYDQPAPDLIIKTQRHYSNLFELPVIYYATVIVASLQLLNDDQTLLFAWIFVAARVVHAFIHVGSNKVYPRMLSFLVGWGAIVGLWLKILKVL